MVTSCILAQPSLINLFFTNLIQYCGTPNYSVIFNSVSSLALTTCIVVKLFLAKRMLPRNALWPVTYEDDLSQLRDHAVRLLHNVINRSQVACLNKHSYCCFQASNLLKRLLASLTHQSIPIEGKYKLHKFFGTLVNVQGSLILSSNSAGSILRFTKNLQIAWQGAPPRLF
jgi:hypothetical protein